jgi:hypothetical protein
MTLIIAPDLRLRHCVIFPKGHPFSIFTAVTFHYRVRKGSMWIHYAIKRLSQIIENFKIKSQAFGLLVYLS